MFNNNKNWMFQKNTPSSHQNPSIQNENLSQKRSAVWPLLEQRGFWGPCFPTPNLLSFTWSRRVFTKWLMLQQCQAPVFSMGSGSSSWTSLRGPSVLVVQQTEMRILQREVLIFNLFVILNYYPEASCWLSCLMAWLWTVCPGKKSWDQAGAHL